MKNKTKGLLIFSIASLIFILLAIYAMLNMSYTANEPIYIMAGYYYITEGETFYTGHPILTHIISALPLLFIDVDVPDPETIYHPFEFARKDWLYYEDNDADTIMFWARLPFLFLSLLFAWYLFRWVKELYGLFPGTIALIFYIFNPDIIWDSVVVMTDMAVAGFMFISCYYLWKYCKEERKLHLILTGMFFGLAISTKSTALFILPVYLAMFLLYRKTEKKKQSCKDIFTIGILALILFSLMGIADIAPTYNQENPFYFQSEGSRSEERLESIAKEFTENTFLQNIIVTSLKDIPVPGSASVQAYISQFKHRADGHLQYFWGEYTQHGVWYYYLGAYLIKTPLALLICFFISIIAWKKLKTKEKADNWIPFIAIGILFFIFSFILKLNIGLRHTLIILLFMIVCSAKVFQWQKWENFFSKTILCILVLWYILASLLIAPFFIPYFNELVGPEHGPEYMLDTSVDFGQDLKTLKEYMEEKNITTIKLRYSGFERPEYRNISYELLECEPSTGIIAVSVNVLYGQFWQEGTENDFNWECFAWLREREPIERVGYSIYIYNITEQNIQKSPK